MSKEIEQQQCQACYERQLQKSEGVLPSELSDLLARVMRALILTREYVGEDVLPPIKGWEWYDACMMIAEKMPENEWTTIFLEKIEG